MLIAYVLVLLAVGMDLRSMRISNRLILVGLGISLVRRYICEGTDGLIAGIFLISFPVILLYLLFLVGALGAGDIKLFSLLGGFMNFKELMWCIIFAFLYAALFSFLKLFYSGNFFVGMKQAGRYLYERIVGKKTDYKSVLQERGKIHFSLAILLGMVTTNLFY